MSERDRSVLRIRLCSTSNLDESYSIEVVKKDKKVTCTCIGFCTQGRCKHVKFYKELIKLFLDAKPGT